MGNAVLRQLYGYEEGAVFDEVHKPVSLEAVLVQIVASVVAGVERLFSWHREDVDKLISNERIGKKGWYEDVARGFQYGMELDEDSGTYADVDSDEAAEARIIAAAWAGEEGINGVNLKVVKRNGDVYKPLDEDELVSFASYIHRVKPAGIVVRVVSAAADQLGLVMDVYYDPLVMQSDGSLIAGGNKPVEEAIRNYLHGLEFNGEFITMKMIDAIQLAEGVRVVEVKSVSYKHANYDYVPIDAKYTPESGYIAFDAEDTKVIINYKVNES